MTWTLIDEVDGGAAASIAFSSIPQTHSTLVIEGALRSSVADTSDVLWMRMGNGSIDTGTNYSYSGHSINTAGTHAETTGNGIAQIVIGRFGVVANNQTANYLSGVLIWLPDYTATDKHKTITAFAAGYSQLATLNNGVGTWQSTSAVDEILFRLDGGDNFDTGSVLRLWGLG